MAKKNYVCVSVIGGLTETQAANLNRDIIKAKAKNAPNARGTSAIGLLDKVGGLLGNGIKAIGDGSNGKK